MLTTKYKTRLMIALIHYLSGLKKTSACPKVTLSSCNAKVSIFSLALKLISKGKKSLTQRHQRVISENNTILNLPYCTLYTFSSFQLKQPKPALKLPLVLWLCHFHLFFFFCLLSSISSYHLFLPIIYPLSLMYSLICVNRSESLFTAEESPSRHYQASILPPPGL